jgi:hypothetical protein
MRGCSKTWEEPSRGMRSCLKKGEEPSRGMRVVMGNESEDSSGDLLDGPYVDIVPKYYAL